MVSLGRLLAAASDSPDSSQGHSRSAQTTREAHWLQDHALSEEVFSSVFGPEGSNAGLVPGALRRAFSSGVSARGESPRVNDLEKSAIPLDQFIADLGPETTIVQNMAAFKRALLSVGVPSENAIAKALILMAERTLRGPTEADSDAMSLFQLLSIFDANGQDSVQDPVSTDAASALWNFEVFVMVLNDVASQCNTQIDWKLVIRSLDCAELARVLNEETFREIAKAYSVGTSGSRIPGSVLVDRWQKPGSQSVILASALLHPELVDWVDLKSFPGSTDEDESSPYSRISVLERMVDLNMIRELQVALSSNPDLVLLCLACAKPENNAHIQQQLIITLVSSLIDKFPSSAKTIRQMWSFAPALIAGGLLANWRKDQSSAELVLDIATDINGLEDLLTQPMPTEFAFDIALLTYSRQQFGFESWLSQHFLSNGAQSTTQCILQLAEKVISPDLSGVAKLSVDAVRIAFRVIYNAVNNMRSMPALEAMADDWKRVHEAYIRHDARIANLDPANDLGDRTVLVGASLNQAMPRASMPAHRDDPTSAQSRPEAAYAEGRSPFVQTDRLTYTGPSDSFSKEIEDAVNVHFHSLYKESISTEQTIELLRQFQVSQVERDRKVFDCMIHTLFDEYRFFKNYPEKELQITGRLFGAFVQYSLFQGQHLEIALERVLIALQQDKTRDGVEEGAEGSQLTDELSRMRKFGLCALDQFRKRLPEWPHYCARILEIPLLRDIAPELLGEVERIVTAAANPPSASEPSTNIAAEVPTASSPGHPGRSATVLGSPSKTPRTSRTLDAASRDAPDFASPDEHIKERIGFILNNLSTATLDDKKDQLIEFLKEEHFPYFIHYLVRRAIQEGNHHELYMLFLDTLKSHIPNLFKLILEKSFKNVGLLLSSDKLATNSAERLMLKTLGAWIGGLTLGRNKPILQRDLDVKKLLVDAYAGGRLTPVVPFVAKVLLGSKGSKIFKPTNPWIKAMLSILKEISEIDDLKLNLKFELPSLLSALSIETSVIVPSNLLKDVQAPSRVNNPDIRRSPQASPRSSAPSPDSSVAYNRIEANSVMSAALTTGGSPTMSSALDAGLSTGLQSHVGMGMGVGGGPMGSGIVTTDAVNDLASVLGGTAIVPGGHGAAIHSVTGNGTGNMPGGISNGQIGSQPLVSTPNGQEPTIVPNFANFVNVSPSLPLFQNSPNLRSLLPIAIDRALKDIIQPVVERSCAIASLTTRELTLKDFANEPNVAKIRKAAQQMVQQLAGSLALVTCKEPLRVAMGNHVRSILTSAVGVDANTIDTTAQHICAANLEMGCAIIERAAKEKAVRDLNDVIGPAFANVRRPQQTAYGMSGPPGPDVLKVYADFSRLPRAILGDGARLSPSMNPSAVPSVQPVGANTNPAGSPALSMPGSSSVPGFPSGQGSMLSEKLQDPRFVSENDSVHVSLNSSGPSALQAQIPGRSLDEIGGGASSALRAMAASSDTQWTSTASPEAQPLMAAPEAMNSAMLQAVATLNAAQANRHNILPSSVSMTGIGDEGLSTPQVLEKFNMVYAQLSSVISDMTSMPLSKELTLAGLPGDHEVNQLWTQIPLAVKKSVTADEACMAVAQKVFKRLYEGSSSLYREVHVALLDGLRESCRRLSKELVIWLAYSEEHKKLNRECIVALLKPKSLINITSYDELLSKTIDNGRNSRALDFAAFLVQRAVIEEPLVTPAELALTFDTMAKIGKRANQPTLTSAPNGLLALIEEGRNVSSRKSAPSSTSGDQAESSSSHKTHKESEISDPTGTREFVKGVLTEFQRLITDDDVSPQVLQTFLGHLKNKTLNSEETRERFCRLAVELVVTVTVNALLASSGADGAESDLASVPYTAVESTVRLINGLCQAETSNNSESLARSNVILSSFWTALVKNILKTSEEDDLRPHFRLFSGLLTELSSGCPLPDSSDVSPGASAQPDSSTGSTGENDFVLFSRVQSLAFLDGKSEGLLAFAQEVCGSGKSPGGLDGAFNIANPTVLAMCSGALLACAPKAAPGFAFCWLQIVAGRNILPRLLNASAGRSWLMFRQLLVSMLAFLSPHLRRPQHELSEALKTLYKGTLRVLLVLLHDFPEFLCDYHFALCDAIPPNCIQLRNLVLAAFPKNMRLPDPFRAELQAGQLPEMSIQPRILSNFTVALVRAGIKGVIDNFLQNATFRSSVTTLDLSPRLMTQKAASCDAVYNVPTINALALYVGHHSLSRNSNSVELAVSGPGTTFFRTLLKELDAEGQYCLFNALANQLRYPNVHTHYFSSVLLSLFKEARDDALKELITRVLVERLIANRPHPWGLLITFIDLIKNPGYNFWQHEFVRCAPQIEHLFENVARFCIGPALQQNSVAG